jgi:hypothetical protein
MVGLYLVAQEPSPMAGAAEGVLLDASSIHRRMVDDYLSRSLSAIPQSLDT